MLIADYRVKEGPAKNLWFRFRAAYADQDEDVRGGDDFIDLRLIVNWDFGVKNTK